MNNSSSAMNTTPMTEDIQRTAFKVLRERIPENALPLLPVLALKDFLYEGAKNAALASEGTERIRCIVSEFEKEFGSQIRKPNAIALRVLLQSDDCSSFDPFFSVVSIVCPNERNPSSNGFELRHLAVHM